MTNKNLALMAIPVLAAILIGGSIAPAYAAASDKGCEKVFEQALRALADGNGKLAFNLFEAFLASCAHAVPANCQNLVTEFFLALDEGNLPKATGILNAFSAACL